jgi:hypothetical protein
MSTRCHIIVEDKEYGTKTILYRHSDGYPDGPNGVLATLVPFVARFMKHRGFDACYMGAQIMCDQINRSREGMREFYEKRLAKDKAAGAEPSDYIVESLANLENDFLGFGISNEVHSDVEFIYHVSENGIHVQHADGENQTSPAEARAMFKGKIPKRYKED